MVALLRPHLGSSNPSGRSSASPALRLVVDNTARQAPVIGRADRRPGSVRSAGRSGRDESVAMSAIRSALADRSTVVTAMVAGLLLVGALLFVRLSQGSPSADLRGGWSDAPVAQSGAAGPRSATAVAGLPAVSAGDRVIVAQPGDSLWSIAQEAAPGSDPRPAVAALIEANGGDTVRIGQQIVIPKQLLD